MRSTLNESPWLKSKLLILAMEQEESTELTNEERHQEENKTKTDPTFSAFAIGFLIMVAVWSMVTNGFSF